MTLTLLVDENIPGVEGYFTEEVEVLRFAGRDLSAEDVRDADALFVRSVTHVDGQLLEGSPVRFVGTATSGQEHIDQAYLDTKAIPFFAAPGANANSVVEYVLSALAVREGLLERLFSGGRVGIAGYGHVGKLLAQRLTALGIEHCVYDPWLDNAAIPNAVSLDVLLGSDVVSLHCALTDAQPWPSRHLIGADALAQMRADAVLINSCRGSVVDGAALLQHLDTMPSFEAILDVWEGEPNISRQLLQSVRLGTAHIAGYSYDAKLLSARMLCRHLSKQFSLTPSENPVNPVPPIDLVVGSGLEGAALLRHFILQCYDVRHDDALLREQAGPMASPTKAAAGFDQLRKHYRIRRELAAATFDRQTATEVEVHMLNALGVASQRGSCEG